MSLTIGVDVGGTKVAGGVVDETGAILAQHRVHTPARDAEATTAAITSVIETLRVDREVEAVADGTPPECHGCPYCRIRRALSDVSPEVYEHLADAVSSLGAALRALDSGRRR